MDAFTVPLLFVRGAQTPRRLPPIDLLEAFLAVVEHGNVARAGRALGLSQPAMSARIARLEGDLGTPLFSRVGRTLAPTPEAQALAPRLRLALSSLVTTLGSDDQRSAYTVLRVGTLPTFSSHLLTVALVAPAAARITMHHALTSALVEDLRRGALDVVVGAGPVPRDPRLEIDRLGEILPAAVVAKGGPALPRVVRAEDLRTHRLAMVPRADEPFFDGVRRWIDEERLTDRISITIPHLSSLVAAAAASELVTIVPSYMVLGDERVRVRPLHGLSLRVPVWIARATGDERAEVTSLCLRIQKVRPFLVRAARFARRRSR